MPLNDIPLRLVLDDHTVDVARRVDGGITITVYLLFGSTTIAVPAQEWRKIAEYAPAPPPDNG